MSDDDWCDDDDDDDDDDDGLMVMVTWQLLSTSPTKILYHCSLIAHPIASPRTSDALLLRVPLGAVQPILML